MIKFIGIKYVIKNKKKQICCHINVAYIRASSDEGDLLIIYIPWL